MDPYFYLAKAYAHIYGFLKDRFGVNVRGLGFLLRRVTRDRVLSLKGKKLYFSSQLAEAYARPLQGAWNEPETHELLSLVMEATSIDFIEVGANIGEILVDIAANDRCASATAFEPNPLAIEVIKQNLKLNGVDNCRVVGRALADMEGRLEIDFGSHSPSASLLDAQSTHTGVTPVEVMTLDLELANFEPKGSGCVLLVDVEGFELKVMQGARDFISRHRPLIIFEYHHETRKVFDLEEMMGVLGDGYRIYRVRKDAFLDGDVLNAWNCVAVPLDSAFDQILKSRLLCAD